jgi:hypothetical protein
MLGVLLTRGPEAVLDKGTTVEMVLDRNISFTETELNFGNYQAPPIVVSPASGAGAPGSAIPRSRFPF